MTKKHSLKHRFCELVQTLKKVEKIPSLLKISLKLNNLAVTAFGCLLVFKNKNLFTTEAQRAQSFLLFSAPAAKKTIKKLFSVSSVPLW